MKLKIAYTTIVLILLSFKSIYSQEVNFDSLFNVGINLHDNNNYNAAINVYKYLLKQNKHTDLLNYEIAYSYYSAKEYKKAIKYAKKVVNSDSKYTKDAYLIYGTSLDAKGNNSKSIEVFKEAIDKFPDNNLLHYNLAISYFNSNQLAYSEKSIMDALYLDKWHASSHLLLAQLKQKKQEFMQSILAYYYFLFLEPKTNRSKTAMEQLINLLKYSRIDNINYIKPDESDLHSSIMFLKELNWEKTSDKLDSEIFYENTKKLFIFLSDMNSKKETIWWKHYISFYNNLIEDKQILIFCYYIDISNPNKESINWLNMNKDKVKEFAIWLEKNYKY